MAAKKNNKDNIALPIARSVHGKLPPQVPEFEQSVLGALMIEKDSYNRVSDILRADCFYDPRYQKIFSAITQLVSRQSPVDRLTVVEELRKNGDLEVVGGETEVAMLTTKVISTANLEYHSQIIVQKFLERELIRISNEIQEEAYDDTTDVEELMQKAEGRIFDLAQRGQRREAIQIDPVISSALERLQMLSQKGGSPGILSGFREIDNATAGWQRSDLIIIAARPAMGKTAFVLSMVRNMAVDFGTPVAMFSLEMSNLQLVNRLLMNVCEIEGDKIRKGDINEAEWIQLDERVRHLLGAPIYIDDTPSLSVFELRSKARRLVREHGVQCIIIDYLQLMNASGMNFGNREQEVSIISRSLKGLAKELDIPIIALAQLNRGVENRTTGTKGEGKRPQLSDLRESGSIEQDADMVMFIHRPEYYGVTEGENGEDYRGLAEMVIAKHRNGQTGIKKLRFRAQYAKFLDIENNALDNNVERQTTYSSKMNNADFAAQIGGFEDDKPAGTPF
ncbi:MAG TPA: replicative DNA helicase [Bacteroidales bacterium]|nr:replicative DNA helicase [Bacteroidales bacterium]